MPQKLGAFTLRDDTDSDEPRLNMAGSVFSDRARLKADIPPATAAAAVRAAAREADSTVSTTTIKLARLFLLVVNESDKRNLYENVCRLKKCPYSKVLVDSHSRTK